MRKAKDDQITINRGHIAETESLQIRIVKPHLSNISTFKRETDFILFTEYLEGKSQVFEYRLKTPSSEEKQPTAKKYNFNTPFVPKLNIGAIFPCINQETST